MMRQFIIKPLISVGEIEFGMDRSKVREILGEYAEYRNREEDVNTADSFDLCHVFYSEINKVEFIMFHSLDDIELLWENQELTKMTKAELVSYFTLLDENLSFEYDYHETNIVSIVSNALGLACYFEKDFDFDEDDNEIETDIVATISFAIKDFWK
jgi:hypothetical protein